MSIEEAPLEKTKVVVNGIEIVLDPDRMKYNENNLAQYFSTEYGWVDYLGKQLEHSQKEVLHADTEAEALYSKKFIESKDLGNSDNYAKACACANDDVVAARKHLANRKEVVGLIKAHLRAWDKNHDNVQNRGHTLRHEMKVLNRDIYDTTAVADDFIKGS